MAEHSNHIHIAAKEGFESGAKAAGPSISSTTSKATGEGMKEGVKTVPLVKNPDGTYSSPDAAWDHLIQRESGGNPSIVQGIQDANSGGNEASGLFQIAKGTWASNGGTAFAPTAGEATPEQQAEIAARIFEASGGGPWGAGLPGREDEAALRAGLVSGTGSSSTSSDSSGYEEDSLAELRSTNKKLDEAIKIAQDPKSSEIQVIQALNDIDSSMRGASETDKQSIESLKGEILSNRGMKEYDPKEGAPESPEDWFNTIFNGIAQNVLGLYNTVKEGIEGAVQTAHLMIRGLSGTDDVHSAIDGVQGLVNSVMSVVSTVGALIETAGSIAAAAGSAIPGIGQIASVIGSVTGVVGNVNAVIDFAQEVASIGGRWIGKGISNLIGFLGGTGELQGQIRTMMDMNDNTIKTWSDRNTADKAVIGGKGATPSDPNKTQTFGDLNVYQAPGQDPAEMMNNAMFAVAAHSQGVYGS
jgi:hypothetical protein